MNQGMREGKFLPSDTKIVDLNQTCKSWGRTVVDTGDPTKGMFTLVKHGTIVNVDTLEQMTSFDLVRMHGWPVSEEHRETFGCIHDFHSLVEDNIVTMKELASLVGDGWVIRTIGLFVMWVEANLVLKDKHRDEIPATPSSSKKRRKIATPQSDASPNCVMTIELSSDSDVG